MMKTTKIFGKKSNLKVGDLVWWTDIKEIGRKKFGIIQNFKKITKGGRFVWVAHVYHVERDEYEDILAAVLHKIRRKTS